MNAKTAAEHSAVTYSAPSRLQWPDVAKGLCILLVVLHHTVGKVYADVVPVGLGPVEGAWVGLMGILKPIRMPLFFVISGFFAASAVQRGWWQSARRMISPYYLYVVWLLIFAGIYSVEKTLPANRTESLGDLAGELVFAATSMWFLFALAAYFALAKLLRDLPAPWVVGAAAAVAGATSWMPLDETNRVAVLSHFVYFAFGAYFPHAVKAIAARRTPLLQMIGAYAAVAALLALSGAPRSVTVLVLSVIGVPIGIGVAVRLAETALADRLAWLGQRTLPVYVMHLALLAVIVHVPVQLGSASDLATVVPIVAYPVLVTAGVTAACLGLQRGLIRSGFGWLFEAPAALMPSPASAGSLPRALNPQVLRLDVPMGAVLR